MKDLFCLTDIDLNTVIGDYDIIPLVYDYRHERLDSGVHMHRFIEIQYNIQGPTLCRMNEREDLLLQDNQMLIIGPEVLHEEWVPAVPVRESVCFSFAIKFPKGKASDSDLATLFASVPAGRWFVSPLTPEIRSTLDDIADEYHGRQCSCLHLLKGLIAELIIRTLRTRQVEAPRTLPVKNLSDRSELLLNHYFFQVYLGAMDGSIKDVSSLLCVSPRQIRRILTRIYNKSFNELVLEYKIQGAANRLLTTALSVSDIAQIYGFCSSSAFGAVFKRHMGVTPGQYRRDKPLQRQTTALPFSSPIVK